MNFKTKNLNLLNLLYCNIPLILFLLGWVKIWIAIPTCLGLVYFLYRFFIKSENNDCIALNRIVLICGMFILLAICLSAGMGNWWPQVFDYEKHNAVLQDLVRFDWPVVYDKYNKALLTYYIGHYLPPALIGKIFGSVRLGDYVMGLWGYLGVIIVSINVMVLVQANNWKKQLFTLVVFLLFSGMLYPLQYILNIFFSDVLVYPNSDVSSLGCLSTLYIDGLQLEYRSIFTDIQWVHQQSIIPWLCCSTLMMHRDNYSNYALIVLPSFLSGTWSFLGIIIIALILVIGGLLHSQGNIWKQMLSASNIFCILIPGFILFFYFIGNMIVGHTASNGSEFALDLSAQHLVYKILFALFMFGIYAIIIGNYYRKDLLFWAICIELTIILFFKGGDFTMCTSIPALFILLVLIIRFLFTNFEQERIRKIILVVCLLIGARNPMIQIRKAAIHDPYDHFKEGSLLECTNFDNPEISSAMKYQYYTYNPDNTIFYKYIMRK